MKLVSVEGCNFLSFQQLYVDFTNYTGPILITGTNLDNPTAYDSNGSGKTSLLDAFMWCWFGITSKGMKADDVINKDAKKDCWIKTVLFNGSELYAITRYRKHKEHSNSIQIECVEANSSQMIEGVDQQTFIDELIGCNYKIFQNAFFFGQGVEKYFAQLSDKHQKEILSELLNLDIIDTINTATKLLIKECDTEIQTLESERISLASKLTLRQTDLASAEHSSNSFETTKQTNIDKEQLAIDILTDELNKQSQSYTIKKEEANVLFQKHTTKYNEHTKQVQTLNAQYEEAKTRSDELYTEQAQLETKVNISQDSLHTIQQELQDFVDLGIGCPYCQQAITLEHTALIKQKYLDQLDTIGKLNNDLLQSYNDSKAKYNEARILKSNLKSQLDALVDNTMKSPESFELSLNNNLIQLKSTLDTSLTNLENKKLNLTKLKDLQNPYAEKILEYKNQIINLKQQLKDIQDDIDLQKLLKQHREYLLAISSNSGAKSKVLQNVTPFLNYKATEYSQQLMDNNIEIVFNTLTKLKSGEFRDQFTIDIKKSGKVFDYNELSGGEKRRVNICVLLALKQLALNSIPQSTRLQLGIFDEVFDGLDATGYNNVAKLLHDEYAESNDICFVVSHNVEMEKHFDNIINIEIQNGVSKIN
mgnify:CR=1 FL=1